MRRALVCAVLLLVAGCHEEGVIPLQRVTGGDAIRGKAAIVHYGCGSCHVIPGVPAATGHVGPPLTDLASRVYLAGHLRNEPAELVRWIRNPQDVHPGTAMPNLGVTENDARDIAAYLYTLATGRSGPPHLLSRRLIPSH